MIRYDGFEDLVDRMAVSVPGKAAFLACDGSDAVEAVTWAELAARVHKRAEELTDRGRSCEAVLADGTAACVIEVFAAVVAGLQVALVDPMFPDDLVAPLLGAVDADSVWAASEVRQARLEELLGPAAEPAYGAHGVLFFTSGTTSASKAVVLTDASLMSSAFNGASLLPLTPDDRLLCSLPLSHVFGFVCGLLWGLSCGATVALGRGARHYVDDFELFQPTAVSVVPKLLEYLVARNALNDGLGLVLVGAADCSDELLDTVRRRGIRASLGYGLTETSSGLALSTGADFHAMSICPEATLTIAEDGEILVSAPTCMMQGYYRDEGKTVRVLRDGVLHTGDEGVIDDEGLLHVSGRIKDVVTLSGGTKVYLPDYENAVARALGERDVAVLLRDDKLTLACGRLSVQRDDEEIMTAIGAAMRAYAPGSRIARIERLGHALPRTAAGDVERWKIQEELDNGDC